MCLNCCNLTRNRGSPLTQKAIDVTDPLGSFYDIHSGRLTKTSIAPDVARRRSKSNSTNRQLLFGQPSISLHRYLEYFGFNQRLQQNILDGNIEAHGISRCLLDYNETITEGTCFLYYSSRHWRDKISISAGEAEHQIPLPKRTNVVPSHVITKVVWGFEFLMIISVENDCSLDALHALLRKIKHCLKKPKKSIRLTPNEQQLVSSISDVRIYGTETFVQNNRMSIGDFLPTIRTWSKQKGLFQPIEYIMQPLEWAYGTSSISRIVSNNIEESTLLQPRDVQVQINELEDLFEKLPISFTSVTLNQILADQKNSRQEIINTHIQLKNSDRTRIDANQNSSFVAKIDHVRNELKHLLAKKILIEQLERNNISYVHLHDIYRRTEISNEGIDNICSTIQQRVINDRNDVLIWYSSDQLREAQPNQWKEFHQKVLDRYKTVDHSTELLMIYVDFSNTRIILKENDLVFIPRCEVVSSTLPSSTSEISVLFFGETGVGKSTFINALANYLAFETLEEAEVDEPKCVLPASFITTINDQFDEILVQLGTPDPNEDHNETGRSTTQKCRSYVFDLGNHQRIRFIDTPGVADTRGMNKDQENMDHIISYIQNYSHLHAICFLCKPNSSRLSISLRYCMEELFSLLPSEIHSNMIFCFTNTRSTFYSPGQTGPLLKKMLNERPLSTVPFGKNNVFCFDNESFRYLVAKKAGVQFEESFRQDFLTSWIKSVSQSQRFLDYLQTMRPVEIHLPFSVRHVYYEMMKLARPCMEALRLSLYNWKLQQNSSCSNQIILKSCSTKFDICHRCATMKFVRVSHFWIGQYREPIQKMVQIQQTCPYEDHDDFLIESIIEHQSTPITDQGKNEYDETWIQTLIYKCDHLLHFLRGQDFHSKTDPFIGILDGFIEAEEVIERQNDKNNTMNQQIKESLLWVKTIHQKNLQHWTLSKKKIDISKVEQIIHELNNIDSVKAQMKDIVETRQRKMKAQEITVNINRTASTL